MWLVHAERVPNALCDTPCFLGIVQVFENLHESARVAKNYLGITRVVTKIFAPKHDL